MKSTKDSLLEDIKAEFARSMHDGGARSKGAGG